MTTLPACLPAGIAVCVVAAGVWVVVGVVSAGIDWRERRAARADRKQPRESP
ncbi:hypothetical protein ACWCPF_26100 [Streptomyces sp. NPDC001858]